MAESPRVLTVDEVAEILRISKWATYEAIKRGEIRAIKVGKSLRISRHEIDRILGEEQI